MMDRRIAAAALGITTLIIAKVILNMFSNPLDSVRADLADALAEIPTNAPLRNGDSQDFARLTGDIKATPSLWQGLIAPPPPPTPPPPPQPTAPDVMKMLANITIGKGQIGKTKIKVLSPESPRGEWSQVGTKINGCTLESFDRNEAVFSYYWEEGGKILEVALPRE